MQLIYECLAHYDTAWNAPAYKRAGDSGFDLRAAISRPLRLCFGEQILVPTGLRFALPPGTELQVRARSGLSAKHGVAVVNGPGTVDEGYRGEVMAILTCLNQDGYEIQPGERIAQAVLCPVLRPDLTAGPVSEATERAGQGFGSSGAH